MAVSQFLGLLLQLTTPIPTAAGDLVSRALPFPNPCGSDHWVGTFCRAPLGSPLSDMFFAVCWRIPELSLALGPQWPRTWLHAHHAGLSMRSVNPALLLPTMVNADRIPVHIGSQYWRDGQCPNRQNCRQFLDDDLHPHVTCRDLAHLNNEILHSPRRRPDRGDPGSGGSSHGGGTSIRWPFQLDLGPDSDKEPTEPGSSPDQSPVRMRPLLTTASTNTQKQASRDRHAECRASDQPWPTQTVTAIGTHAR